MNIHRVPVTDNTNGNVTHFDVSFQFSLDPVDGRIFNQDGSVTLSPPVSSDNIRAGTYIDPVSGSYCYAVEGPSLLADGRSSFSIKNGEGCGNTGFSALFVTGSPVGHPDIGGRTISSSLSNTRAYGVVGTTANNYAFLNWPQNGLIGVRQNGDQLVFSLFTDENGQDSSEPVDTAVLSIVNN